MDKHYSRLELLPNEILLLLLQYFNAQDLFRAFYNLNYRFNQLIQSFNELKLVYQMKKSNENNDSFSYYVYTLVIDHSIDVNLRKFSNIYRLKLISISKTILVQLNSSILPNLEHLTLYHTDILKAPRSLNILKFGCINSLNYTTILSSCSNLRFLDIGITAYYRTLQNIIFHENLQRMIIRIGNSLYFSINDNVKPYLSCVPNLKYLCIHFIISDSNIIESYIDYDWFKLILNNCLPLLERFRLYLYFYDFNPSQITRLSKRIEKNFQIVYNNQYQSRLFIHQI